MTCRGEPDAVRDGRGGHNHARAVCIISWQLDIVLAMRAYSSDLRTRIVAEVVDGTPASVVAHTFRVGAGTVRQYVRQQRQGGSLGPRRSAGRPRQIPRVLDRPCGPNWKRPPMPCWPSAARRGQGRRG
jgi:transposase-like protein